MPIPLNDRQKQLIPFGVTFDIVLGAVVGTIMDDFIEIPIIFNPKTGEWRQRDDAGINAPREAPQQAAPMQVDPFRIQPQARQGARLRVEKPVDVKEFWWDRVVEVPQVVEIQPQVDNEPFEPLIIPDPLPPEDEGLSLLDRLTIIKDNLPNPPPELMEVIEELHQVEMKLLDTYEEGYQRGRDDERENG